MSADIAGTVVQSVCAVLALVILVGVAERIMPLRAVERDRWEWNFRPQRRFPDTDKVSIRQAGLFGALGLLAGYAVAGFVGAVTGGAVALAVRWFVGVRGPARLPRTLDNGTTRAMFSASSMLFDSELAANIYAAGWLRNTAVRARPVRGPTLPALMVRRVLRRGYIPALFLVTALLGVVAVPGYDDVARIILLVTWGVLASAVWRATRLGVVGELRWRWAILAVVTVTGIGVQWLWGVPDAPLLFAVLAALSVVLCGVLRGRPRNNDDFTIVDDGLTGGVPVGMVGYWFAGWSAVIPAMLAVWLGY